MSADYTPALWIPTDHFGGWTFTPRYIIVHGTAGGTSAQGIAQYFQGNDPPTSTHYVVGVDGTVAQCVSESDAAWGNGVLSAGHDAWWSGNPNDCTFSIEHCKPHTDNSDELSPAQREASFALIKHLCERHDIPRRWADATGGITGHYSIDPVNRQYCPGAYPWDALFSYLNGGGTVAGVPANWHDDGTTLTAPNGHKVVLGFRQYVMGREWAPENQPLEDEHGVAQTEWHAQLGSGTKQIFLRSILRFNPTREQQVMESDAGAEVFALERKVADLQAQLAAAQTNGAEHQALMQIKAIAAGVQ
ncbi:MAG TPA: peptidoglycan recognition family protein [Ktedonobacterales bacterium]|nr:peptidoglycan recognition family protein [Ktedonobacterales bacterium]